MCDTVVALGSVTADGAVILGKNSDREPNETQHLLRVPAARHAPGSAVQCTYIEIPQVAETYEVLLSKPAWMWGAEMGSNQHGVTIGNEAVFTRVPYEKGPALTGMDLLRLALERAATARAALDVITGLLAAHGQGGNCGYTHDLYYHNSFLIADPADAWVLETAGPHWAAVQVQDVGAISNRLTIGREWDLASDDLVAHAVARGWCTGRDDFDFARCYSDWLYTTFAAGAQRRACTLDSLNAARGRITPQTVMATLRSHAPSQAPLRGLMGAQVCMHVGLGPIRNIQTAGSLVSHLTPEAQTHFATGTSAPCTSLFKPVWLGAALPDTGPVPGRTYDPASLWWRHEALHRATLPDHARRLALYAAERDSLEAEFVAEALACEDAPAEARAAVSQACFARAGAAEAAWLERVRAANGRVTWGPLNALAWRGFDRAAEMPG
jgi:secernin